MENYAYQRMKQVNLKMDTPKRNPILTRIDAVLRRCMDIFASFVGLLILLPTFIFIAVAIKRDSPGPIFYRGQRAGRGGKEFGILKFRTMYENEKSHNGSKVTAQDDPRITLLGKKLRDTKANELPQLWNVLMGDMSLVGPRPEDPDIVKTWPEEERNVMLSVRPGVTSPATILYRNEESLLSSENVMQDYLKNILPSKLRLDTLYVRNRTIFNDLDVIFLTAIALLPNVRRLAVPEHLLYWGPFTRLAVRYLSWLLIDSLVSMAAVGVSGLIWRLNRPLDIGWGCAFIMAIGISWLFSLVNWIFGLNRVEWSRAPANEVFTLGVSTSLAMMAVISLNQFNPWFPALPVSMVVMAGILSFFGFVMARYRERVITGFATRWLNIRGGLKGVGERVLVVGAGQNGALASWMLGHTDFGHAISVIGMVDDDPRKLGMRMDGHSVLGTTMDIPRLVKDWDIGIIFFTIDNINPLQRKRILSICKSTPARMVLLPDILAVLKQEMKVVSRPDLEEDLSGKEDTVTEFLDEIQTLLEKKQVGAAQEKLAAFRQHVQQ